MIYLDIDHNVNIKIIHKFIFKGLKGEKMKVRLKEQGYIVGQISLSNLIKEHFINDNSVSFRNFHNQIINIDIQDGLYCLQCNDNLIKNYKSTLEEVKEYIKRNAMK